MLVSSTLNLQTVFSRKRTDAAYEGSPKFQLVIPNVVREGLRIRPGQLLQVLTYGDRIELLPIKDIGEMMDFQDGMDTSFESEPDRELSNNGTDPLNLIEPSGWIEYLSDGANTDVFAVPLFDVDRFIAPSVRIYEV